MFRLDFPELIAMFVILVVLFGPKRLPWMETAPINASKTFNAPFFLGLGVVVGLFALALVAVAILL